jgi:hypothetical protein
MAAVTRLYDAAAAGDSKAAADVHFFAAAGEASW